MSSSPGLVVLVLQSLALLIAQDDRFEHRENALDGRGRWLSQHDSQRCRVPGGQPLKAGGVPQGLNVTLLPWVKK